MILICRFLFIERFFFPFLPATLLMSIVVIWLWKEEWKSRAKKMDELRHSPLVIRSRLFFIDSRDLCIKMRRFDGNEQKYREPKLGL